MYATDGLSDVLGITGDELKGKSFYYCIEENCLQDAVRCLENAKANDSIAYLRFWYRDPRQEGLGQARDHGVPNEMEPEDQEMEDMVSDREESANGEDMVDYQSPQANQDRETSHETIESAAVSSSGSIEAVQLRRTEGLKPPLTHEVSVTSSGRSSNPFSHEAVFGEPDQNQSSASSMSDSPTEMQSSFRGRWRNNRPHGPVELEAVVSCTSDGLVVCLRRARPAVPQDTDDHAGVAEPVYANGLFAVPWATAPIMPSPQERPLYTQPPEGAYAPAHSATNMSPLSPHSRAGPDNFMSAIRDIVVFAWALVGINGSLAEYGHGKPRGEAQPASGLPIWQPDEHQVNHMHDGMSYVDGYSARNPNRGVRNTPETGLSKEMYAEGRQEYKVDSFHGGTVDGVSGVHHGARMDHDGRNGSKHQIKSESPANNYSYPLPTGQTGKSETSLRSDSGSPLKGHMVDGVSPNSNARIPWQTSSAMDGTLTDRRNVSVDGIAHHHKQMIGTGSSYTRPPNGNSYGFGDPGLSSKNVFKPYTATPIFPHEVFEHVSGPGSAGGHQ